MSDKPNLKVPSERIDEYLSAIDTALANWEYVKDVFDITDEIIEQGRQIVAYLRWKNVQKKA